MCKYMRNLMCLVFLTGTVPSVAAQPRPATFKTLSVADGIPQSYISGLVQDKQGFIWIGTRDGLAKYDGRKFRIFRHINDNPSSISANIIKSLTIDEYDRLWIACEQGELDVLDTRTERITHFTSPDFHKLRDQFKSGNAIVLDQKHKYWILGRQGDLFIVDYEKKHAESYTVDKLIPQLSQNHITGIGQFEKYIILVTDNALVYIDPDRTIKKTVLFNFKRGLYNPKRRWKDNSPLIRKNGEVIIVDEGRLIIYNPQNQKFTTFNLPQTEYYIRPSRLLDNQDNFYFGYEGAIYKLDTSNTLSIWSEKSNNRLRAASLLLDRSGVMWVGTNGYGIKQFDLYLNQMPQISYLKSFPEDVLQKLGLSRKSIDQSFIKGINPYFLRWTTDPAGRIWLAKSGADLVKRPNIGYVDHHKLIIPAWKVSGANAGKLKGIDAITTSPSGKLWAIDYGFELINLDIDKATATIVTTVPHQSSSEKLNDINGLTMTSEDDFWISSTLGIIHYQKSTGITKFFFGNKPERQLLTQLQDPSNPDLMWLGSYSSGLIRFNKRKSSYRSYTIKNGLPNNTVYTIVPDNKGLLWCSSNTGIFSFNPVTERVQRYATQGELSLDEFNRFHFFKLPDGRMFFGGSEAYTQFDPEKMFEDAYEPHVALTDIRINNKPADFGDPGSTLDQSINSMRVLRLPYYKNFLSFEFAALEFNNPKKLRYRYKLTGLDKEWVMNGTDNTATYTTIPPGSYLLKINGSNTTGRWSNHIKTLSIIITPPFWKTWWFITGILLLAAALIYVIVRRRIANIRKKDQEKMAFERETIELEAQALRSQMNPHFIFNCLNSIKALIQEDQKRTAVVYLTTFSKLIRTQLNNNKQEISLHEELETCKLYLQLEALRFGNKITYTFETDRNADLHAVKVPPLIIQPFIENAIIHGILPREKGGEICISIIQQLDFIICSIDDDGIGRERAARNNMKVVRVHQSRGTQLVENRLNLHNTLNRHNISLEITDKKDKKNQPAGTRVTLKFKSEHD